MMPILTFDHVTLRLPRRIILDDFSLCLGKGDFLALIGANGAGKTTLLRVIMGFLGPESGVISLLGKPASDFHRLRKHIGYVPQVLPVDFKMPLTVEDIVAMGRYGLAGPGRRLRDEDRIIINSTLRDVGIDHLRNRPIGHLSGGEYQKVQIARAVCQTPDLLLLDEPTSNLDLGAQKDCLDLISRLHDGHQLTTIIVMHDLKSLPERCNRAVIIDDAQKVFDGPFSGVFTEQNLAHIYKSQPPHVLRTLAAELCAKGGTA
jgi:ABC-type Mn2+/Zn2+ transport system ATPase subunit